MDHVWLTDEQFTKIAPLLPNDTRGKERVDDRRVISGIVHGLKSGGRWTDAPRDLYGPKKTPYNRFVRWAAKGVWVELLETLARAGGPPSQVLIDSTAVKAHRCAAGGKGGAEPSHWSLAGRAHDEDPRPHRPLLPPARLPADRRAGRRLHGRRAPARTPARLPHRAGRQGLRQRRHTAADCDSRCRAQHPAKRQPPLEAVLLTRALARAQRHRTHVRPPQGLPPHRHPLRPSGDQLSRRRLPRRHRQLLVMRPDGKVADKTLTAPIATATLTAIQKSVGIAPPARRLGGS